MKALKRAVLLLFVASSVCGVGGCGMKGNMTATSGNREQEVITEMEQYFQRRYPGVSYSVDGFIPSGWDGEEDILNLSTVINGENERFYVSRCLEKDGTATFGDTYLGLLLRDEVEQMASAVALDSFPNVRVFVFINQRFPEEIPPTATVAELKSQGKFYNVDITVLVSEEEVDADNFREAAKAVVERWGEEGIPSYIRVILVGGEIYGTASRYTLSDVWVRDYLQEYHEIVM